MMFATNYPSRCPCEVRDESADTADNSWRPRLITWVSIVTLVKADTDSHLIPPESPHGSERKNMTSQTSSSTPLDGKTVLIPGEVAIAWVASKGIFPIMGPRSMAQLRENLGAADLRLSAGQIQRLDAVSAIPDVFPYTVLNDPRIRGMLDAGQGEQIDAPALPVA